MKWLQSKFQNLLFNWILRINISKFKDSTLEFAEIKFHECCNKTSFHTTKYWSNWEVFTFLSSIKLKCLVRLKLKIVNLGATHFLYPRNRFAVSLCELCPFGDAIAFDYRFNLVHLFAQEPTANPSLNGRRCSIENFIGVFWSFLLQQSKRKTIL